MGCGSKPSRERREGPSQLREQHKGPGWEQAGGGWGVRKSGEFSNEPGTPRGWGGGGWSVRPDGSEVGRGQITQGLGGGEGFIPP